MISRSSHFQFWRALKYGLRWAAGIAVLLLGIALAMRWHQGIASLEDTRSQIFLSIVGALVAGWLLKVLAAGARRRPKTVVLGISLTIVSLLCYLLLVWTSLKTETWPWRLWWISTVGALWSVHSVWLFLLDQNRGQTYRLAAGAGLLSAIALSSIALAPTLPPDVGTVWMALIAAPILVACGATIASMTRRRMERPGKPVSPLWRAAWVTAAVAITFAGGFYAGRVSAPIASALDEFPSPLTAMPLPDLQMQIDADLRRLQIATSGLDQLNQRAAVFHMQMNARRKAENRSYYTPAEEDELRAQFMTYLAYRAALLRLVATYAGFDGVQDSRLKAQCFLVGFTAGTSVLQASTNLVTVYGADPQVRRKLNETDVASGIPAGTFDRIDEAVVAERNFDTFHEMAAYYESRRDEWKEDAVLPAEEMEWISNTIDSAIASVRGRLPDPSQARIRQIINRVKKDTYTPVYAVQSVVSTWIGDTRMVKRPPFISHELVKSIQPQLQPGDILLERRNWFFSNAFLPGFWPHAALYVGTPEDLRRLGIIRQENGHWTSDHPAVRDRLMRYLEHAHDHEPNTVLESVSEGVIFNSLTHSMGADYVAVLRPRLSDEDKARAIVRAFAHEGKPYDFEFDFFTADKLVCTELVYRSYEGMIDFDLVRIMGRDTLPALEICHKFSRERTSDNRQLDFVLFLDAIPAEGSARLSSAEAFCASAHRPRGFNE